MNEKFNRLPEMKCVQKRFACIAVSSLLVLSCFATSGCSNNQSAEDQSSDTTDSSTLVADIANMDRDYTKRDKDASYDEAASTRIQLNDTTATVEGDNVNVEESNVTISSEGTYVLSGALSDGQVIVEVADTDKVQLVLNNATIHNEDGPAIYVKQADKCFITLGDNSTNTLTDGANYTLDNDSDEPYATLFSKDDLTINGTGTLNVEATYRHAICSKDDLVITGGNITTKSVEDALRGRDCVKIADGIFTIESGEDAIKSNNDEDATCGFVSIDGGTFAINAGDDAIHGEFAVFVEGGQIDVSTCYEGLEAQQVYVNGGTVNITSKDDSINASSPGESTNTNDVNFDRGNANGDNFKGGGVPNADNGATAEERPNDPGQAGKNGENFTRDTAPGNKGERGNFTETQPNGSGETPPQGDAVAPDGGNIAPQEGEPVPNDAGDNALQGKGAKFGGGMMGEYEEGCLIEINGGEIGLVTEGDGIDSNGDFTLNGGTLNVSGPTNNGNSSMDVAGSATVNGGNVVMAGSAGMAQSFTNSSQAFLSVNASGNLGDAIQISTSSGEEILSFIPKTQYSFVIVSSPLMEAGTSYTVTAGQTTYEAQAKS